MNTELTPLLTAAVAFGWISGIVFTVAGIYLSVRHRRMHPLLASVHLGDLVLLDRGALRLGDVRAVSARTSTHALMVAAEHDLGRAAVVGARRLHRLLLPACCDRRRARAAVERTVRMAKADHAPDCRPDRRLLLGLGVQRRSSAPGSESSTTAYVIPGLGLFEGTLHQYPIYDAIAMGIQMMVFTYLLGRTDSQGRNVIEMWADKMSTTRVQSAVLSVVAVIVIGNVLYGAVFAPHLVTKLGGLCDLRSDGAAVSRRTEPTDSGRRSLGSLTDIFF